MTYRAVATPSFRQHWLNDGLAGLADAPMVDFDRKDGLQRGFLNTLLKREAAPPTHYVPTSADFARAVMLGMGWGMLPDQQSADALADGTLIELAPHTAVDVQLYWQRWNLRSSTLDELTRIVVAAAAAALK
jgi:LysR family transcriptional regulator (chromosome initiation inhibitor)